MTPNPSPMPTTPSFSQSVNHTLASKLEAFDVGKARKGQATSGLEDGPTQPDPCYLGTPLLIQLKNLFTGALTPPNLLDIAQKLNDLVKANINLPNKGAEEIKNGSETAADIKTLTVQILKIDELNANILAIRCNLFSAEDDDHQVERALAGAKKFGCRVPDAIKA